MTANLLTAKEKITLCEKKTNCIGGRISEYFLYNLTTLCGKEYYALEVSSENESDFVVLGVRNDRTLGFYRSIVEGDVSPISLFDIVCDAKNKEKY